jgi:type II secretory pathway pseudopilin PulG
MVVIAIIGILTAVVFGSVYSSRSKARDAKRISDIAQIQLALEQYFDKCRQYPSSLGLGSNNCITGVAVTFVNYIAVMPRDPSTGVNYDYKTDANKLDYVLHATLENNSDAINDGLSSDPLSSVGTPFTCDPTNKHYCIGPK